MSTTTNTCNPILEDRRKAALLGLYVGESTAMPVHWMYNLAQLHRDYGQITRYVKPKDKFEGSIMNLSNTGGGGRGSDHGDIVGTVINHGKKKFWLRGGNYHYHIGLEAGENTLEAQLCRVLTRCLITDKEFRPQSFLNEYIRFMTTPGSHNDTYAATAHRMFFANYALRHRAPTECADNDGHNVDAIDGLVLTIPIIVWNHGQDEMSVARRNQAITQVIQTIRKSSILPQYAIEYANILIDVLHGENLRQAIEKHGKRYNIPRMVQQSRGEDPMVACYIDSSFPVLLFFAYKYADNLEAAILASANAGGENVARGALLGALVGAAHGIQGFPAWAWELKERDAIIGEIDSLLSLSSSTST